MLQFCLVGAKEMCFMKKNQSNRGVAVVLIILIVLLVILGIGIWFYWRDQQSKEMTLSSSEEVNGQLAAAKKEKVPEVAGVWRGVLPCADCSGIDTELTIFQEQTSKLPLTYTLVSTYQDSALEPQTETGSWTLIQGMPEDPQAPIIMLGVDKTLEEESYWLLQKTGSLAEVNREDLATINPEQVLKPQQIAPNMEITNFYPVPNALAAAFDAIDAAASAAGSVASESGDLGADFPPPANQTPWGV